MADSPIGLDRSIDTTGYSPVGNGDGGLADRQYRTPPTPSEGRDGPSQDLASLMKLGTQKLDMGDDTEATELFRKALETGDRTLGPDHPDLVLLLNDLTRLYLKQSDHAAAEPLLLRLLDMKRSKGEDHPEVATVLASLAAVRQALGRHESAEQLWRRVVDIRERTLAPNHFAIATALEHLAEACAARGNIPEALSAFQRAQTIRERTLGSGHSSIRISQERIADLRLQASENSFELAADPSPVPTSEQYRLAPGEQMALTVPTPPAREKPVREKPTSSHPPAPRPARQTKVTLRGFADLPPIIETTVVREEPARHQVEAMQTRPTAYTEDDVLPYRDALESVWDELEEPDISSSIAERSAVVFESVIAFLGKREVIAGVVVGVILLAALAVATNSHAWGEADQAVGIGASPSQEAGPPNVAQTTAGEQLPTAAHQSAGVASNAGIIAAPKALVSRPRVVVEDKNPPKKGTETKSENRKLVIPTLSNGVMSRLDSVASRAGNVSSRIDDGLTSQPLVNPLTSQRSSFDYGEQTSAQRARLIGELPTPRVPDQVTDVEGEVRVRFNVDTGGVPVMSTFAVVNSPNPLLTAAVRKVIPSMRFEPARSAGDGKPIVDVVQIGFQFSRVRR